MEYERRQYNSWLRAPKSAGAGNSALYDSPDLYSVFDAAAAIEVNSANTLTLNGGFWITTGTSNYATSDGVHPGAISAALIAATVPTTYSMR